MNYLDKFADIKHFIFDVDGVFTDNQMLLTEQGELLRSFNARDGFAVKYAIKQGYSVSIITGGTSNAVALRFKGLGVTDVFIGVEDKKAIFENFIKKRQLEHGSILYMGDDLMDIPVLRLVGLSACPNDAIQEVKGIVQYISPLKGGAGCVREVIEKVLKLHGKWPTPQRSNADIIFETETDHEN